MISARQIYKNVAGDEGEFFLSSILKKVAKRKNGYVFSNLHIPSKRSAAISQIDHIYVDHSGVYIIETKRWTGKVIGTCQDDTWTVEYDSPIKAPKKMLSPYKQNSVHVYRLNEYLRFPPEKLHNCVVFVCGVNLINVDCNFAYTTNSFYKFILRNNRIMLSREEIADIIDLLTKLKAKSNCYARIKNKA